MKTSRPFARYDRDFPLDTHFLAMPERVRLAAYGFLLALNGHCYARGRSHPPATGTLTLLEAAALADRCGQRPRPLLAALSDAGLIKVDGKTIKLPRFFDWNPELDPSTSELLSSKRRAAAATRWGGGDANEDASCIPSSNANEAATAPATSDARWSTEIRERERGVYPSCPPIVPPSPLVEAIGNAWLGKGRQLTGADLENLVGLMGEFRVPTAEEFAAEMEACDLERVERGLAPIRRVMGYRERFRRLNDRLRDEGRRPRDVPAVLQVATGGLSAVGDVARSVLG